MNNSQQGNNRPPQKATTDASDCCNEAAFPPSEPLNSSNNAPTAGHRKNSNIIRLLKKSRREFLMVFDSVPAMIWYRDPNGKILRVNRSAADSVNRGVRELAGKNYYDLFPDGAERSRQQDLQVIQSGYPLRKQLRQFKALDGKMHWAMVDRIPLRDKREGKIVGVMVFAQDITEQKEAEDHLVRAKKEIEIRNEQLRIAAEKARELATQADRSNQAKNEVLASSSHDLRTPMNAIIGFSDLLLDTDLDEEQAEYAKTIHQSATGLLALINDIMDYTKLEAGKLNIQIISCKIADILEEIKCMMAPSARQKGLSCTVQIDPRLSAEFFTDPVRLKQCLINLIGNAVKFTHEGSIDVQVKPVQHGLQKCICFDVKDTGIGIPKEKQQHIFKAFSQADNTTEQTYGGTGLGLSITRKFTELLGGHISVISEEGIGSIFSITLPLLTEANRHKPKNQTSTENRREKHPCGKPTHRVLIVEGNMPSQLTMTLLLRRIGLEAESAGTVNQLFNMIQSDKFDFILLDLELEKGRGIDVVRKLRDKQITTPIIAIADCDMEVMEDAIAAGCNKYLTKPVSRKQLFDTIEELKTELYFEAQLRTNTTGDQTPTDCDRKNESVQEKLSDVVNGTFNPNELMELLPEILGQLRDAVETAADAQACELIALLEAMSRAGEKSQLIEKVDKLQKAYHSPSDGNEIITQLIDQIELFCSDVLSCTHNIPG